MAVGVIGPFGPGCGSGTERDPGRHLTYVGYKCKGCDFMGITEGTHTKCPKCKEDVNWYDVTNIRKGNLYGD